MDDFDYIDATYNIIIENKVVNIYKIKSKTLQQLLKCTHKKITEVNITSIHRLSETARKVEWSCLWYIKNPVLRFMRYKLLLRDVYSNERRFRYGLGDSEKCMACKQVESVEHMIFDCSNAIRVWDIVRKLTWLNLNTFSDLLYINPEPVNELIISCAIKFLIQID